ncbi:hypothetical protein [Acidithiobacillus ferrooxidans]|uniref:Uncharacterized protein n=1 Tax=Acidithiobacillus ferrooxidans TaxID=920 RepID=A0A2W1KR59_ACIFR|nr:hypothetical protein [Acidithiobacillus ferrooxidans]MBU2817573.1 hypothetical protein [Acidithiobacillus ferrooxidans]MCR1341789.1 hypothetical protein [Acidithiobacillus ferrooxidans]PZD81811.1 hypothetical protein DN052_01675 [Acidithiobacillus ferrooxidans]QLK41896.1 hypothetical protein FE661_06815 [Acidithiobacillus ferrooxidans]QZT53859.1 hypothetical protein K7B00_06800 [Acidithiobacillus ferrooxidans]
MKTISRTGVSNMIREILKAHPICDGSGHLVLASGARPLTREKVMGIVDDVKAALREKGVIAECRPTERVTRAILFQIVDRIPPRWPEQPERKVAPVRKPDSICAQRVAPVTVIQKRRIFHYPPDLVMPG